MLIPIKEFTDVVQARRQALDLAASMGFSRPDATKVAAVVSELGRNIVLYAGEGTITLVAGAGNRQGITIIARDQGPGIEDAELALTDGYSTSGGLGLGLPGSKRMVDEFEVWSVPDVATQVKAVKYLD